MRTLPYGDDFTGHRWQDLLQPQAWLLDNADRVGLPPAEVVFLWELCAEVYRQGTAVVDWERDWYTPGWFPAGPVPERVCNYTNHGVNAGMSLKSGALVHRFGFNAGGNASSHARLALLDAYHGVPTGVFQADEHLAGKMPSHGTETCTVVEAMWSLNVVFSVQGDASFADRSERIAYNALPGSMTKDFNARVYLQQNNEVAAVSQNPHVWISDNPDSLMYSLERNYDCCTVNFLQGWPRFIQRMVVATPDGGVAVALLGPVSAQLPSGVAVTVTTDYPFDDDVTIELTGLATAEEGLGTTATSRAIRRADGGLRRPPLADVVPSPMAASRRATVAGVTTPVYIRIPSWAIDATLAINGGPPVSLGAAAADTMYRVPLDGVAGPNVTLALATRPAIRVSRWFNGSLSVSRGALVYALQLSEEFELVRHWWANVSDWNVRQPAAPAVPWNVALIVDPAFPERTLNFERVGPVPDAPFSAQEMSVRITGVGRAVRSWTFARDGSAAPPPASPVDCGTIPGGCGPEVAITLVPGTSVIATCLTARHTCA